MDLNNFSIDRRNKEKIHRKTLSMRVALADSTSGIFGIFSISNELMVDGHIHG